MVVVISEDIDVEGTAVGCDVVLVTRVVGKAPLVELASLVVMVAVMDESVVDDVCHVEVSIVVELLAKADVVEVLLVAVAVVLVLVVVLMVVAVAVEVVVEVVFVLVVVLTVVVVAVVFVLVVVLTVVVVVGISWRIKIRRLFLAAQ